MRVFGTYGAIAALLAVALGAFGAHALRTRIEPAAMATYQTGIQYHLFHAIALLLVGVLAERHPQDRWLHRAGWLFTAGILLFSGSLYALALSGVRILGAITPFGGVCFLLGWISLALFARHSAPSPS